MLFKLLLFDNSVYELLTVFESILFGEFANIAFISDIVVSLITGDFARDVVFAVVV